MASHDNSPRSMDNIRVGDKSIANQGDIDVFQYDDVMFHADPMASQRNYHANNQTNTHNYYGNPVPGTTQVQTCVRVGLPSRNANRVERKELLEKLDQMLPSDKEHEPVALWGLAGSGKTQLALHYAHQRFSAKKCSIFWVHARDENAFIGDFRTISRKAGIDRAADDMEMLHAVREWVESQPIWVMVIDGADDVEIFTRNSSNRIQPRDFIPEGPNGTVIWTSQDRRILEVTGWTRGLEVGSMTQDEAVSLCEIVANHGVKFSTGEAIHKLVQELGCHPLVVSHIATLMRGHFTPREMLSRLAQPLQRGDIFAGPCIDLKRSQHGARSVFDVLAGQVARLAVHDPEAYRIIAMIAYMDRRAIPLGIFLNADGQGENEPARRAIARLKDLSLLLDRPANAEGPMCDIDGLVQEAIRHHLDQSTMLDDGSNVSGGRQVHANLPSHVCFRNEAISMLSRRFPRNIYYDTLKACGSLVEHALKLSQWEPFVEDAIVKTADLLIRVGDYLLFCGRWKEMETPYQRALELRKRSIGTTDSQTIEAMDSLAQAQMKLGYYRKALKLFTEARQLRTECLGLPETHPDVMASDTNIGVAHRVLGHFDLAETLHTKVLALRIETLGECDPDSAQSMYEMARLYNDQGVHDKQTELLRKSLSIRGQHLGNDNPKTMETKLRLGSHLYLMRDGIEGRKLQQEVLELQQRLLGRLHPLTLETRRLICLETYPAGNRQKALQAIGLVYMDCSSSLGDFHPLTWLAWDDLERLRLAQALRPLRRPETFGLISIFGLPVRYSIKISL